MSEIRALSSMATRRVLERLALAYGEASGGRALRVEATGGVDAARRVRGGERLDLVLLASAALDALERDGFVLAGSQLAVARSEIAVAVAAGAPAPPIGDGEAVRRALLQARRVSYSTGPSGDHLQALWRDWGLAEVMAAKSSQAPPGRPVAALIADGEADLGFQQLSELKDAPGVQVVGPLPPEIQQVTVFAGAIAATCQDVEGARAALAYLASPATAEVKRSFGMEPAG